MPEGNWPSLILCALQNEADIRMTANTKNSFLIIGSGSECNQDRFTERVFLTKYIVYEWFDNNYIMVPLPPELYIILPF